MLIIWRTENFPADYMYWRFGLRWSLHFLSLFNRLMSERGWGTTTQQHTFSPRKLECVLSIIFWKARVTHFADWNRTVSDCIAGSCHWMCIQIFPFTQIQLSGEKNYSCEDTAPFCIAKPLPKPSCNTESRSIYSESTTTCTYLIHTFRRTVYVIIMHMRSQVTSTAFRRTRR